MNFILVISIKTRVVQIVAEAMINKPICIFGPPKLLMLDKDSAFTGKVIQFILRALNFQLLIISSSSHGSFRTELQTIGKMIAKCLAGIGEMWPLFTTVAVYARNTFVLPSILGYHLN